MADGQARRTGDRDTGGCCLSSARDDDQTGDGRTVRPKAVFGVAEGIRDSTS